MNDRYQSPLSERYASREMQYIFSPEKKWFRRPYKGSIEIPVVDIAPMTNLLRDRSRPVEKRVTDLLAAKKKFEEDYAELLSYELPIETDEPSTKAELDEAERARRSRGLSLPRSRPEASGSPFRWGRRGAKLDA